MDDTTILDGINNDNKVANFNSQPKKLILRNLNQEQIKQIKSGGIIASSAITGAVVSNTIDLGFVSKDSAIASLDSSSEYIPEVTGENLCVEVLVDIPFSENVTDEMTFTEAFSTARNELGPGGFFEWKGTTYNTYYKEEWDHLREDQQQEYYSNVQNNTNYESIEIVENSEYLEDNSDQNSNDEIASNQIEYEKPEPESPPTKPEIEPVDIPQEDPNIVKPVKATADMNHDEIPDAIVFDNNDDGYIDILITDINQDGQLESYFDSDGDLDLDLVIVDTDNDGDLTDESPQPLEQEQQVSMSDVNIMEIDEEYASDDSEIEENMPDLDDDYPIDEFI